jgi:hypothetical protein
MCAGIKEIKIYMRKEGLQFLLYVLKLQWRFNFNLYFEFEFRKHRTIKMDVIDRLKLVTSALVEIWHPMRDIMDSRARFAPLLCRAGDLPPRAGDPFCLWWGADEPPPYGGWPGVGRLVTRPMGTGDPACVCLLPTANSGVWVFILLLHPFEGSASSTIETPPKLQSLSPNSLPTSPGKDSS